MIRLHTKQKTARFPWRCRFPITVIASRIDQRCGGPVTGGIIKACGWLASRFADGERAAAAEVEVVVVLEVVGAWGQQQQESDEAADLLELKC